MSTQKKVLVAMSGGLDSSAVCMMLIEQGYAIEGITMRMWDTPSKFILYNQEDPDYIIEARELASRLGFKHHVTDIRPVFNETVVSHFINEYLHGRTPNPCVYCNKQIKWHYLLEKAKELNCDFVATGHYATIEHRNNHYYILQGDDDTKDQSYFLWRLGDEELSKTLFPLGGMHKSTVREYLRQRGFTEKAEKPESMEVCFIDGDYRDFLRAHVPDIDEKIGKGNYVNNEGKKIGIHDGFPFYTIGQRKGLGIALGYPAFVTKINPIKNTIKVGPKEELLTHKMEVRECRVADVNELSHPNLHVRIRYRSKAVPCKAEWNEDGVIDVTFDDPVSAVTPGQSAVFYIDQRVVGGGIISTKRRPHKSSMPETQEQ